MSASLFEQNLDQGFTQNPNEKRFNDLKNYFEGELIITRKQFRDLMRLSPATEYRMFKSGEYPKCLTLPNGMVRIELSSLSDWLANGASQTPPAVKRGRPRGSRNKIDLGI